MQVAFALLLRSSGRQQSPGASSVGHLGEKFKAATPVAAETMVATARKALILVRLPDPPAARAPIRRSFRWTQAPVQTEFGGRLHGLHQRR